VVRSGCSLPLRVIDENAGRAAKSPASPRVCLAARFNASLLDSLESLS